MYIIAVVVIIIQLGTRIGTIRYTMFVKNVCRTRREPFFGVRRPYALHIFIPKSMLTNVLI